MLKIILGSILLILSLVYFALFGEMEVYSSPQAISALIDGFLFLFASIWLIKRGIWDRKHKKEDKKKVGMKAFFKEWLRSPFKFNVKYATEKIPPYFLLTAWIFGVAHLLNVFRLTIIGNPLMVEANDWWVIWLTAILMGIFWGVFLYYVIGFIFHGLIKLSGGKSTIQTSSNILLYSNAYLYLAVIFVSFSNMITFGNSYFYGSGSGTIAEILLIIVILSAVIYSLQQIYSSVISITHAGKKRAFVLTSILPLIIILIFGWVKYSSPFLDEENIKNIEAIRTFQEGDTEESEALFDETIEQFSEKGDTDNIMKIYINEGILFESSGQPEKAKSVYNEALSKASEGSSHYFVLNGLIAAIEGDAEKAIDQFTKALELDANDFNANNRLGMIYLGRIGAEYKDLEKALIYNQKAYELNPNDAATVQNLAINYYELGKFNEALPLFLILAEYLPDNVLSKYLLGMTYHQIGDLNNAKKYLNEAVSMNSDMLTEEVQEILDSE
ncbi:tetratricopeptide repeat protein [Patescibacteria group bacterium]|nr:tetratricopeptide repeat protein [Patescibacteria group bacterium]MBU1682909.1 tetratricopeptide repeat protein [Patescibacteria group bacterium]MBU1935606.1 tetratricopeptide repeat protein [Patescibacteria group bacterium]